MAQARLRKKKKEGVMSLGGKIITIFFALLLVAGGYFLFTLFRTVEINSVNMTGEWKLTEASSISYWSFEPDSAEDGMSGLASYYTKQPGTGMVENRVDYTFKLELNSKGVMVLHCTPKDKRLAPVEMKINSLSHAQMSITYKALKMANMTRTNLF